MRDYFKEFLINKNPVSLLGDETVAEAKSTFAAVKPHIIWALVALSVGYLSWKAGKWYAGYQLMKQQASLAIPPAKT